MIISADFLEALKKSKIIKVIKMPKGHYTYEYAQYHYAEGKVFGTIDLENAIIDDIDYKIVGYFGVNLEHNILVYNLKDDNNDRKTT